jgi:four helix bundle protein
MSDRVDDFKQLRVYRLAFDASRQVFAVSKQWPSEERYSLTDQARRASRAVCAAIAEAWFKRQYPRHFASKLSDAGSEAAEMLVWLDFADDAGYLAPEDAEFLRATYRQIMGGLVKMMTHPEQWCIPTSSRLRESPVPYDSAPDSPHFDTLLDS